MAPEVSNKHGSGYNSKADIYSLGVIAQQLFHIDIRQSFVSQIQI